MATMTTTSGKAIKAPSRDFVTLYARDGSSFQCAPIDARESLASGFGYSLTPPGASDEQQPESQPVVGDEAKAESKAESKVQVFTGDAQSVETGESVVSAALSKLSKGRKAKA